MTDMTAFIKQQEKRQMTVPGSDERVEAGHYSKEALRRAVRAWRHWFPRRRVVSLLEIGCCGGEFLMVAKRRGWAQRVHGMTINKIEAGLCHKVAIPCTLASLNAAGGLPFPDAHFSCVFSRHTLEHVAFPFFALSEMLRISLRYVLISTPRYSQAQFISRHVTVPTRLQMAHWLKLLGYGDCKFLLTANDLQVFVDKRKAR